MKKKIFEDDIKIVYQSDSEDELIFKFKDEISDKNSAITIKSRGILNNDIAVYVARLLSSYHLPSTFRGEKSNREVVVKNCQPLPFLVNVKNEQDGATTPTLTLFSTDAIPVELDADQLVSEALVTTEHMVDIRRNALKINAILKDFFRRRSMQLEEFKVQYGVFNNKIIIYSPFTLESWSLKDVQSEEKYDVESILSDKENADARYSALFNRIKI